MLLHFNKEALTYDLWHCSEYKVVRSFSGCEAGGKKVRSYTADTFFKTVVQLLKTNEQEITTSNHQAWIKTAAEAVLNDEMPGIEAEQERLKKEIEEVEAFINFYQDQLDDSVLTEKRKR